MIPNDYETLLFSFDLGPVSNYDPGTPLARLNGNDPLRPGQIYLRLTLDEMMKIRSTAKSLHQDHHTLLRDTRAEYDDLMRQSNSLEELLEKRSWIVKFFQRKMMKRLIRAFIADAVELYESTKTKSDKLRRDVLSIHTTDCAPAESESVGKEEQIKGVSVDLGGPVTPEAIAKLRDAASFLMSANSFTDTASSESQDGGTSVSETEALSISSTRSSVSTSPSSPGSASGPNFVNIQVNCIFNTKDINRAEPTISNGDPQGDNGSCIPGVDLGSSTSVNSTSL